jgi:hypothetical protein
MFRLAILLLALAASPAIAQNVPTISLSPGEAVTIRFDDGGRAGEPERSAATWSRFDLYAARHLAGMAPPDAPVPEGMPIDAADNILPDPIPREELRLRMMSIAGQHVLLVVENGRERALAYRARMVANGRETHTDVCVVLPRLPSYEHWAFPIERLELSDFRFIPWAPARNPTCE